MIKKIIAISLLLMIAQGAHAIENFLHIQGVAGESTDTAYQDPIDIQSWSWGTSWNGNMICVHDISVTKWIDKASPLLLLGQVQGRVYPLAHLYVREEVGEKLAFIELIFTNLRVDSTSTGASNSSDSLTENITLKFDTVEYIYRSRDPKTGGILEDSAIITSSRCK